MTRELYTLQDHGKLVVVMVGLPARGKSYIARKLARYLNWLQYDTKIFNVGDRRRNLLTMDLKKSAQLHSAAFFDPDDVHAKALREQVAMESLDALLDHLLLNDGSVALFDATNSSRERRELILARVRQRAGPDLPVLFLESQCSDLGVSDFSSPIIRSSLSLSGVGSKHESQAPWSGLSRPRRSHSSPGL
jgi:6-phosphofructo-2-kinase